MSVRERMIVVLLSLTLTGVAVVNAQESKFHPVPGVPPVIGHYLVTLSGSVSDELLEVSPRILAQQYDGRLEHASSTDTRQFAVALRPSRAKSMSGDPRVREVMELPRPNDAESPVSTIAPSRADLTRHGLLPAAQDSTSTGIYLYDGAGNIKAIGTDSFLYDSVGRLTKATVQGSQQSYTYDAFGNRTSATRAAGSASCVGGCETTVTVIPASNHIAEAAYDEAGNVTSANGVTYAYDGSGMVTRATVGSDDRIFLYTADDERLAVRQGSSWTWTVRDLNGKVLREFTSLETSPSPLILTNHTWSKDYVWRDGLLLASVFQGTSSLTTYHYHLDHLGTPRLITGSGGSLVAKHTYYPFGAEMDLTPHESAVELMKFTGHERDIVPGENRNVDYMHARFSNANLGRFLEVDARLDLKRNLPEPQRWNRYAYVVNNPIRSLDPDGKADNDFRCVECTTPAMKAAFDKAVTQVMKVSAVAGAAFLVARFSPSAARLSSHGQ